MIFGKSKLELKVGIFVFFGFIVLSTFILLIGNFKTWGSTRRIKFIFNFVNGIKLGAPIRFAGVDVGEVRRINFFFSQNEQKEKVELTGLVRGEIRIPSDSKAWVNTLGLLGEKYIELMPGKNYAQGLSDGGTLIGNDPLAMHEMGDLAKSVLDNINEAISGLKNKEGTLGKLIYDDSLYNELIAIATDTHSLIKVTEDMVVDIKTHPWKLFFKPKEKPVNKK